MYFIQVTDMATVLQVITVLEGIQITKEQLETTRLGKYINLLRRKTTVESLARRAKNLLKKWREMVLPVAPPATSTQPLTTMIPPAQTIQTNAISNTPMSATASITKVSSQNAPNRSLSNNQYPHQYSHINDYTMNGPEFVIPKNMDVVKENTQTQHNQQFKHLHIQSSSPYDSGDGVGGNNSGLSTNDDPKHSNGNKKSNVNNSSISNRNLSTSNRSGSSIYGSSYTSDLTEDCQQTHKINAKQKQNKQLDAHRMYSSAANDSSKSPISISALPKIPKIKKSASSLSVNKNVERSQSPLVNSNESVSPLKWSTRPFSLVVNDDSSVHQYDKEQQQQNFQNYSQTVNGREQIYYGNDVSMVVDTNSNSPLLNAGASSSSALARDVIDMQHENTISETKKKHKKHKKEKKSKKQKQSSPAINVERSANASNVVLELPDSLSSSSMSLFTNTSSSAKVQPQPMSTANNSSVHSFNQTIIPPNTGQQQQPFGEQPPNVQNISRPPSSNANESISADNLTFSGKFTKIEDNAVISIDSSSCSNSPKYVNRSQSPLVMPIVSRSSSPSRINVLATKQRNIDDESLSNQKISMLSQTTPYSSQV